MGPSMEFYDSYHPSVTRYPLALTYLMQAVGLVTTFQQVSASSLSTESESFHKPKLHSHRQLTTILICTSFPAPFGPL